MSFFFRKNAPWIAFALFVATALYFGRSPTLLSLSVPLAAGKVVVWSVFLGFLAYSLYCSTRENLFTTIRKMASLYWGRQIGIDLYIGLGLSLGVIYLNEGSVLCLLLWTVPVLIYANLATLLYVAVHYDALIARLLG